MHDRPNVEELSCDLCVAGAGIAGLNALFAATRYLARGQKVVLIDRNEGAGGMWNSAYDYVRLHQPHPLFTAGNIAWTFGNKPSYLATRREVLGHLRHCLDVERKRLRVDERFGYEYRSHEEPATTPADVVVQCDAVQPGRPGLRITTKRFIKAFGFDVHTNAALALSSQHVRSVSPDRFDLLGQQMRESDAPIFIVGGGKTGMDTAYTLISNYPKRAIYILIGEGTMFGSRDKLFPAGLRRYWLGATPLESFLDVARRFDGYNEREVLDFFRRRYAVSLIPKPRRFLLGLLSEHENQTIARGVRDIITDYLTDVADIDGQPTLRLRNGERRAVEPGSWFINCTGYFHKHPTPHEPYLSRGGSVLSIQATSAIHALTTNSGFLLAHLWFRGALQRLPLYELDMNALYEKDRDTFAACVPTHSLYNGSLAVPVLPRRVIAEFGVDLARWYPAPRRLLDGLRFIRYLKQHPDHLRRSLDVVRERFGIACGPLPHVAQV